MERRFDDMTKAFNSQLEVRARKADADLLQINADIRHARGESDQNLQFLQGEIRN